MPGLREMIEPRQLFDQSGHQLLLLAQQFGRFCVLARQPWTQSMASGRLGKDDKAVSCFFDIGHCRDHLPCPLHQHRAPPVSPDRGVQPPGLAGERDRAFDLAELSVLLLIDVHMLSHQ
ncbi:hypothetical protein D3C72_1927860 [compost metagenome]